MNTSMYLAALIAVAAVTGCSRAAPPPPAKPATAPAGVSAPPTMSTVGDRISDNLRDSVAAVGEVAYAERAQFMAAHRAELQRLATELDRIRAVAENATGEAKESAAKAVEGIRAKLEAARQELDLAQQATEDSWHNTSSKLAASYDAVVDSLAETRTWAAEKIAPPGMGVSPDRKSEGQRPGG